ncbi:MAG: GNAT family N-acetyltransferase [Pseudomonadales bacterium]|nr:GNAT family N-acetyltransferase [Pseudomonadales bacterium]
MNASPSFHVLPLAAGYARDLLDWRYQPPYDFYDPPEVNDPEHYIQQLLNPELRFHAIVGAGIADHSTANTADRNKTMIGFCSYGIDGQVLGGDYSLSALDIGLGMKPCFTGQGLGGPFLQAILHHARLNYAAVRFRLTVADFNRRALNLYHQLGFYAVDGFSDPEQQIAYTILLADTESLEAMTCQ